MAPSDRSMRAGFALPAVLAVTGVVTLIFLVAITALTSLNAETAAARSRVRFLQNALTVEAEAVYLATTEPLDTRSIRPGRTRLLSDQDGGATRPELRSEPALFGGAAERIGMTRAGFMAAGAPAAEPRPCHDASDGSSRPRPIRRR